MLQHFPNAPAAMPKYAMLSLLKANHLAPRLPCLSLNRTCNLAASSSNKGRNCGRLGPQKSPEVPSKKVASEPFSSPAAAQLQRDASRAILKRDTKALPQMLQNISAAQTFVCGTLNLL